MSKQANQTPSGGHKQLGKQTWSKTLGRLSIISGNYVVSSDDHTYIYREHLQPNLNDFYQR